MSSNPTENVVFFLDVHSNFLSHSDVVKGVEYFIEEKMKINPQNLFSAFYFAEGKPIFLSEFRNGKELGKLIEKDWKKREQKESFFENGLFYCLSYLAEKAQISSGTFRVLVISDLPSVKNAEYTEALMNVVENVRMFPTFIDIIRVGQERFYKDDVKLRVITVICNGALFYLQSAKKLLEVLGGLVHNKSIPQVLEGKDQIIDPNQQKYFEFLAKSLIPVEAGDKSTCKLCNSLLCKYCKNNTDKSMKCPNCGTQYHECCGALYAWKMNIGLKHIFRCIQCGSLLKLDEQRENKINQKYGSQQQKAEIATGETWSPPKTIKEAPKEQQKPPTPIASISSTLSNRPRRERTAGVTICSVCGSILKAGELICKTCGKRV